MVSQVYGITISELLRRAAVGLPMPTPPPPKLDAEVAQELRRIGTNLNQAMAVLNRVYRSAEGDREVLAEARTLMARMNELDSLLREIRLRHIGIDPGEGKGA